MRKKLEKIIKNHIVLNNPIAAMIILMIWGAAFYNVFGYIFKITLGENFMYWAAALGAVLALLIHKAWFSPEFKGSVRRVIFPSKDILLVFAGYTAVIIVSDLFSFIVHEVDFTISCLSISLMAGLGEEMFVRVLPISVMMRDWMDEKHIPFITYSTAIIFGLLHLMNIKTGATAGNVFLQVVFAIGIGTIFAAYYIRTGNILPCIVLHVVNDVLATMVVGEKDGNGVIFQKLLQYDLIISYIIGVGGILLSAYLIRKSVRADIVEVWKERWNRN